jgi:hypothetical protein
VNSVEKLCYTTARKFLGIFRLRGARITDQFCGSEVRQAGFSWDFYYPLITSVQKYAQIANEIVALFKSEFFNSIPSEADIQLVLVKGSAKYPKRTSNGSQDGALIEQKRGTVMQCSMN